jgi:integrase
VDEDGCTSPLAALDQLRARIRTRHYSYRTECSYADWVRRFLRYLAERDATPRPRVDSASIRDYLTHLAVRQRVSASSQNQALSAILFLCREVLGIEPEHLVLATRARRGIHLPVVLSVPETAALLGALRGTTWLMAALIYGSGLRVSECCELRIKDVDFDQGLLFVRRGKGDKDRSTLLAEAGRVELRAQLQRAAALHADDRRSGLYDDLHPRRQGASQPAAQPPRHPAIASGPVAAAHVFGEPRLPGGRTAGEREQQGGSRPVRARGQRPDSPGQEWRPPGAVASEPAGRKNTGAPRRGNQPSKEARDQPSR